MQGSFAGVALLAFDIDGTLTDATTTWLGPEHGWAQTYSVRDGEALMRLRRAGIPSVPLSRNATLCARVRMESLGMNLSWMGVREKGPALEALSASFGIPLERIAYIGDGEEDAVVLERVGFPCAVADAHPRAKALAKFITHARGGERAVEELVDAVLRDSTSPSRKTAP